MGLISWPGDGGSGRRFVGHLRESRQRGTRLPGVLYGTVFGSIVLMFSARGMSLGPYEASVAYVRPTGRRR